MASFKFDLWYSDFELYTTWLLDLFIFFFGYELTLSCLRKAWNSYIKTPFNTKDFNYKLLWITWKNYEATIEYRGFSSIISWESSWGLSEYSMWIDFKLVIFCSINALIV